MKFVRLCVASLAAAACSGQIARPPDKGGSATGGSTSTPTPPPAVPACAQQGLPPARLWRLTHTQWKNTLADAFGFTSQVASGFPADSRLDGFANSADRLAVSSLLTDYYYRAAEELSADVLAAAATSSAAGRAARPASAWTTSSAPSPQGPGAAPPPTRTSASCTRSSTPPRPPPTRRPACAWWSRPVVLSPHFLFRTELGAPGATGTVTGADRSRAGLCPRLHALGRAARRRPHRPGHLGKLHEPATLAAEARRLLSSAKRAPAASTRSCSSG
jgi:hypothetical protein